LLKDGTPITSWANLDEAFLDVAKGVLVVVQELMDQGVILATNTEQPSPHVFCGTVTVNGLRTRAGTEVTALIGGQEQAFTYIKSDGTYTLLVPKGNGIDVTFRVGAYTAMWKEGGADVLNLTVRVSPRAVRRF
jgi:hypothetical protein